LLDLGPTLAGWAGADFPTVDACDLMAPGCRKPPSYLVSSDQDEMAVIARDRILVVNPRAQTIGLYDYRTDPLGTRNLVAQERSMADQLLPALLGSPASRAGSGYYMP
jgi:hypothetical protein